MIMGIGNVGITAILRGARRPDAARVWEMELGDWNGPSAENRAVRKAAVVRGRRDMVVDLEKVSRVV